MPVSITEGRSGMDLHQIDYPDINSCITITVLKGNALAGAHFVTSYAQHQERRPELVWAKLQNELKMINIGAVNKILILGSLGSWRSGDKQPLNYEWPTNFKIDIIKMFGTAVKCFSWDSQEGQVNPETRLIRITKNGKDADISYGKYDAGKIVGSMQSVPDTSLTEIKDLAEWGQYI